MLNLCMIGCLVSVKTNPSNPKKYTEFCSNSGQFQEIIENVFNFFDVVLKEKKSVLHKGCSYYIQHTAILHALIT